MRYTVYGQKPHNMETEKNEEDREKVVEGEVEGQKKNENK